MRRSPIVLGATAVGVAGVLSFKARPETRALGLPHRTHHSPRAAARAAPAPRSAAVATTRTLTGDAVANPYGTVQVRITLSNGRITAARAIQLPSSSGHSQEISAAAGPELDQEALAAQSAQIDGVSGASYTSAGYQQSLQAALDRARSGGA